ncbi:hypothetical protein E2C01_094362 [Portunus trituberculatus]|uniref:Uncharacterized protein n=1 Tax=Portunus trituberculatus TaxID=210409 RepID=A0A5B7JQ80_PORTR|nr:hypothetical protein [Portunus trituberculatus]
MSCSRRYLGHRLERTWIHADFFGKIPGGMDEEAGSGRLQELRSLTGGQKDLVVRVTVRNIARVEKFCRKARQSQRGAGMLHVLQPNGLHRMTETESKPVEIRPAEDSQSRRLLWEALVEGNLPPYSDLKMMSHGSDQPREPDSFFV